jgi:hypothetical protein
LSAVVDALHPTGKYDDPNGMAIIMFSTPTTRTAEACWRTARPNRARGEDVRGPLPATLGVPPTRLVDGREGWSIMGIMGNVVVVVVVP